MGRYKVRLTESAYQDLDRITDYVMEYSPTASYRIYNALIKAYKRLETFPLMGPEVQELELRQEHYRKLIVEEYVTFYRFVEGECIIEHVFHGKQDYQGCFSRWIRENSDEK